MIDMMHRKVVCDTCRTEFVTDVKTYVDGDLEITYFRCPECSRSYLVSVTDGKMRKAIEEHVKLAAEVKEERKKKKPDAKKNQSRLTWMRDLWEYNLMQGHSLKLDYRDKYEHTGYPWERE